jgi:hypothetical protein
VRTDLATKPRRTCNKFASAAPHLQTGAPTGCKLSGGPRCFASALPPARADLALCSAYLQPARTGPDAHAPILRSAPAGLAAGLRLRPVPAARSASHGQVRREADSAIGPRKRKLPASRGGRLRKFASAARSLAPIWRSARRSLRRGPRSSRSARAGARWLCRRLALPAAGACVRRPGIANSGRPPGPHRSCTAAPCAGRLQARPRVRPAPILRSAVCAAGFAAGPRSLPAAGLRARRLCPGPAQGLAGASPGSHAGTPNLALRGRPVSKIGASCAPAGCKPGGAAGSPCASLARRVCGRRKLAGRPARFCCRPTKGHHGPAPILRTPGRRDRIA